MTIEEARNIFYNGIELAREGKYNEAIEEWERILTGSVYFYKALFKIGKTYYDLREYQKAIEAWQRILAEGNEMYYLAALFNIGGTYYDLKEYQKAIEIWQKIPDGNDQYYYAQFSIGNTYDDLKEYQKAIETWLKIPYGNEPYYKAQFNIGVVYNNLKEYQKAIEAWQRILEGNEMYDAAQWNIGNVYRYIFGAYWYIGINLLKKGEIDKATQAFINSKKDVFELIRLFTLIDTEDNARRKIKKEDITDILSKVIEARQDNFFNLTINEDRDDEEKVKTYKKLLIDSLYIVSLLHVDSEEEKQVAHYTKKTTAEQLLFAESNVRLASTIGANDPKEGISLLDFLGITDHQPMASDYLGFIACFTFNHQSLNQFRLYGKENKNEATGVSIVVDKEFFRDDIEVSLPHSKAEFSTFDKLQGDDSVKKETPIPKDEKSKPEPQKYALFRCIYLDPKTQKVISIGHKEEYNFYREGKGKDEIDTYNSNITSILKDVRTELNDLNEYIKDNPTLDTSIVSELLLPLRHLTKHFAFKEEQECRIFDIENLTTSKIVKSEDDLEKATFSKMYIETVPIIGYTEKVFFAPKTPGMEQFYAYSRYKKLNFECERCDYPFIG